MKTQREVEEYLYSFFNLGARWWLEVNATGRLLYTRERYMVRNVHGVVWAPRPVCTCAKNPAPQRDSNPRTVQSNIIPNLVFLKVCFRFRYLFSGTSYTEPYQHTHFTYRRYYRKLHPMTTNKGVINTFIFAKK
jgi:hypothetical protein